MLKTIRTTVLALAFGLTAAIAAPAPAQPTIPQTVTPHPGAATPAPTPPVVAAKPADIHHLAPTPGVGMPTDRIGLQPQVTPIGHEAERFHDVILVPMMAIISALVLVLLIWVILRYRSSVNPVPSKTHHNTTIEIIWTGLPVLILLCLAVPSIKLLAHQYSPPKADLTVKAIGNQWYWTYQYPDNGDFEVVSNMLPEKADAAGKRYRTDADGPPLLAADERMVVPTNSVVKVITTSADVIHSFAMPAFWTKMDAIPGRLNETWFKTPATPGVYFGQCSELCGARHAFMPIAIEVVPPATFRQWVAFKGGTMPGAKGAANPDATATSPASGGVSAAGPVPADAAVPGTTAKAAPLSQPAVAQN